MRITTTYDRITHRSRKSFTCTVCGKRGVRSTTFGQTVNPFNRDKDGLLKTVSQIESELEARARAWHPTMHERCEHSQLPPALRP